MGHRWQELCFSTPETAIGFDLPGLRFEGLVTLPLQKVPDGPMNEPYAVSFLRGNTRVGDLIAGSLDGVWPCRPAANYLAASTVSYLCLPSPQQPNIHFCVFCWQPRPKPNHPVVASAARARSRTPRPALLPCGDPGLWRGLPGGHSLHPWSSSQSAS